MVPLPTVMVCVAEVPVAAMAKAAFAVPIVVAAVEGLEICQSPLPNFVTADPVVVPATKPWRSLTEVLEPPSINV